MLNSACGHSLQQRGELVHVVRADVPLVGPRVHGDALRAGLERDASAARVTLGMPRCRVLRSSATLLTLTDSAVRSVAARMPPVRQGGSSAAVRCRSAARRSSPGACAACGEPEMIVKQRAQHAAFSARQRRRARLLQRRSVLPCVERGLQCTSVAAPIARRRRRAPRRHRPRAAAHSARWRLHRLAASSVSRLEIRQQAGLAQQHQLEGAQRRLQPAPRRSPPSAGSVARRRRTAAGCGSCRASSFISSSLR